MSSFHFQNSIKKITLWIFTLYVTNWTSFQENEPYTNICFTCHHQLHLSLFCMTCYSNSDFDLYQWFGGMCFALISMTLAVPWMGQKYSEPNNQPWFVFCYRFSLKYYHPLLSIWAAVSCEVFRRYCRACSGKDRSDDTVLLGVQFQNYVLRVPPLWPWSTLARASASTSLSRCHGGLRMTLVSKATGHLPSSILITRLNI